jgi:hypothetical protein
MRETKEQFLSQSEILPRPTPHPKNNGGLYSEDKTPELRCSGLLIRAVIRWAFRLYAINQSLVSYLSYLALVVREGITYSFQESVRTRGRPAPSLHKTSNAGRCHTQGMPIEPCISLFLLDLQRYFLCQNLVPDVFHFLDLVVVEGSME